MHLSLCVGGEEEGERGGDCGEGAGCAHVLWRWRHSELPQVDGPPSPQITLFPRRLLLGKRPPPRAAKETKRLRDGRLLCSSASPSPSAERSSDRSPREPERRVAGTSVCHLHLSVSPRDVGVTEQNHQRHVTPVAWHRQALTGWGFHMSPHKCRLLGAPAAPL